MSRFDGKNFKNYNYLNGLKETNINVITEDETGNIFLSSASAIYRYTGNELSPFTKIHGNGSIINISSYLGDGVFAINYSESNKIFLQNKPEKITSIVFPNIIETMVTGNPGELYVLERGGSLSILKNGIIKKIKNIKPVKPYLNEGIKLYADPANRVWYYAANSQYVYQVSGNSIKDSIYMPEGKEWWLWTIGFNRELYSFDLKNNIMIRAKKKWIGILDNKDISGVLYEFKVIDSGNTWISTSTGLYRVTKKQYEIIDSYSPAFYYTTDKSGYKLQKDSLLYQLPGAIMAWNKLAPLTITNVYVSRHQDVWFCTENAVYILEKNKSLRQVMLTGSYAGANTYYRFRRVIEDLKGGIWISSYNGVFYLKDTISKYYFNKEGLTEYALYNLVIDKHSIVYVAGAQLFAFHKGRFHLLSENLELPIEIIRMAIDKKGNAWISQGNNKIFCIGLQDGKFIKKDSLELQLDGNPFIAGSIAFDTNNNMWLADNKNIYCYSIINGKYTTTTNPGIWNENLNGQPLLYTGSNNKLHLLQYVSKGNFLRSYDIDKLKGGSNRPFIKVLITEIMLNRKSHDWFAAGFETDNKSLPLHLSLRHNENFLKFIFSGITKQLEPTVVYQYRLLGFEKIWSPVTSLAEAEYTGLPPGNYDFEVRAKTPGTGWGPVTNYAFTIHAVWYKTNWAFLLWITALAVFLALTVHWRLNASKKKQELKQQWEQERMKRLRVQLNPHFLQNIFASLAHHVYTMEKSYLVKSLDQISIYLRKVLVLSDQHSVTLETELELAEEYILLKKYLTEKNFQYQININENVDVFDIQVPSMFLQPLLENALKYGMAINNTERNLLIIDLAEVGFFVRITIKDSGNHETDLNINASARSGKGIELTVSLLNLFYSSYKHKPGYSYATNKEGGRDVYLMIPKS